MGIMHNDKKNGINTDSIVTFRNQNISPNGI